MSPVKTTALETDTAAKIGTRLTTCQIISRTAIQRTASPADTRRNPTPGVGRRPASPVHRDEDHNVHRSANAQPQQLHLARVKLPNLDRSCRCACRWTSWPKR